METRVESTERFACDACGVAADGVGAARGAGDLTWFRVGLALALAGQGMVFGLGYNNALASGHAPAYGSAVYWLLHGALMASALAVMALLGPALWRGSWAAWRARTLTVESLFLVTASGAFFGSLISTVAGEGSVYYEVVAVVLAIYTVGRKVGARTRERALAEAGRVRAEFSEAFRVDGEGDRRRVALSEVAVGDERISVFSGEAFTIDGVILEGQGEVQETAVNGELTPILKRPGDRVFAGSQAFGGPFRVRVTATRGGRLLDRVLGTVEGAARKPARAQREADRLMRLFLPFVIVVSLATFVVWLAWPGVPWWRALFHAMAVLLVACPCALGLATPIAIWSGLLGLSRRGLVGKNGAVLDALARAELWIFDKTGTLGEARLAAGPWELLPTAEVAVDWLAQAVASLEDGVPHPVAEALAAAETGRLPVADRTIFPGVGVSGEVDGRRIAVGRLEWLQRLHGTKFSLSAEEGAKARVGVRVDDVPTATVALGEAMREETEAALQALQADGVKVRILSGDPTSGWTTIGGVAVEGGLSPTAKADVVRAAREAGTTVLFVGDGMNDAAAMAEANAGIAMGGASALTRATADAALLGDRLSVLPWARSVAKDVTRRLAGNLRFALIYNLIGMGLAASGQLHPVVAALLMLGSSAWVSWRAAQGGSEAEPQRLQERF